MINVKKGTAHSLQQIDVRGTLVSGVTAGMICFVGSDGAVAKVPASGGATWASGIRGFAINNSTDGDAIESNKIALYALDGGSILETDQTDETINSTNYPVGAPVYPSSVTAGLVSCDNGTSGNLWAAPIGWVEGIRSLPQQTVGTTITQGSKTYKAQVNINVLSIKLSAAN